MKHIYSILLLVSLLLAGTSCEDDYRDMVFFTGDAPIYQIGTCNNLISSVNLYLTKPDGIVIGVDGGDGSYSIVNADETIATAAFTKSDNDYQRILVTPKGEGQTVITVKDGSGISTMLRVRVEECVKYVLVKSREGIVVTGDATEEQKAAIMESFTDFFTVKPGGYYEMIPDDESAIWEKGTLRVHPDDTAIAPLVGHYEAVVVAQGEGERRGILFAYNGEEHIYNFGIFPGTTRMPMETTSIDFWEDVTAICPVTVPEGCMVYHVERLYKEDSYWNE